MTKLDEGRLMAYVDGELNAAEAAAVEAWVQEDDEARRTLEALRLRRSETTSLLALLDEEPPTARVREGLGARAGSGRRTGGWSLARRSWAQAAALVVFFGGAAAAAIPGSPVRAFLARTFAGEDVVTSSADAQAALAGDREDEAGVRVTAARGSVEIVLRNVVRDTPVSVALVDGDVASVYGPTGTTFQSGDGWIEASLAAGDAASTVRVEIPRGTARASLEVNGRIYLVKDGDNLDLRGPSSDSTATEIRFLTGS